MPSRTVEEWATVARISRSVRHLFVEGESDARLLTHVYGYRDDVDLRLANEICESEIPSHPLCGGMKLRLVQLGVQANSANTENLKVLVDTDFETLKSYMTYNESTFLTSFANLPVSTFTFEWFKGFLIKSYGLILNQQTWQFINNTLKFAFAARFKSAVSPSPRAAPELGRYIALSNREWKFDEQLYVAHFFELTRATALPRVGAITAELESFTDDPRLYINSNDLFDVIYSLLRHSKAIGGAVSRAAVRQAFFGAADDELLAHGAGSASKWVAAS